MIRLLVIAALVLAAWLAFGPQGPGPSGPAPQVTLAELAADPARWDGQRVTVTARVVDRATFLGLGGVVIGDDQGRRLLATGWTGPVGPGASATVTGEYRLALAVGRAEIGVLLLQGPDADRGG